MPTLTELLNQPNAKIDDLGAHLDKLAESDRIAEVMALRKADQVRLWDLAAARPGPVTVDDLVPPDAPALRQFPFEGKNSLPLFSRFQKVFYKTSENQVAGYNNQSMAWFTGPGYYVAHPANGGPGPVVIDYTMLPASKPEGWPRIKPNDAGMSRFVYGGMNDFLRRVSKDVVVSRAYRHGKETPNYFVLCRGR